MAEKLSQFIGSRPWVLCLRRLLSVCLYAIAFTSNAQDFDTVRIMTYNALYYGENTSFCTSANNNINDKDVYFKVIAQHAKPDIMIVNEMGASAAYTNRILSKVLNVDGTSGYLASPIQNNSFSGLVNGIFYNGDALVLDDRWKITKDINNNDIVRVIDVIRFYYNDANLSAERDTVFFYVLAAHLKAGSSSNDEASRGAAAEGVMDYLSNILEPGYYFFGGDFNLQASSESAYQALTATSNGDYRFYDPLDEEGNWHNNSNFSDFHTQSTRTSNTNSGCFSGGGLDDRFDLILMSDQVIQDTGEVRYLEGSYRALGQDGNHFNLSLTQGNNNSVPSNVLAALYEMSDHLPVIADFRVKRLEALPDTTDSINAVATLHQPNLFEAWIQKGALRIESHVTGAVMEIYDISGHRIQEYRLRRGYQMLTLEGLSSGVYIARVTHSSGVETQRFVWIP